MKKISILALSSALLLASNIPDFLKGTFLENALKKNPNIELKYKKINNNIVLINIIDTTQDKTAPIFEDLKTKSFFIGQMITKDGKVVNSMIVDKKDIQKAVAFTFGKGNKEIYIFTDPECPYCRKMEKTLGNKLAKNYKVHVILFPLPFHKNAKQMTLYVLAGKTNEEKAKRFKEVLHDVNKWKNFKSTDKDLKNYEKYMKKAENAVRILGVQGTPSVYDENLNAIPDWGKLK